jgi:hypothetical protein
MNSLAAAAAGEFRVDSPKKLPSAGRNKPAAQKKIWSQPWP